MTASRGRTSGAVREMALRLLAAREHSAHELRRKLLARDVAPGAVDEVLDRLVREGLQSDPRFAESYVESRMRRGFGPRRIRLELRQRGISETLVESSLPTDRALWLRRIAAVAEGKFGPGPAADRKEQAQRARFLEYRGFDPDIIERFLRMGKEP